MSMMTHVNRGGEAHHMETKEEKELVRLFMTDLNQDVDS